MHLKKKKNKKTDQVLLGLKRLRIIPFFIKNVEYVPIQKTEGKKTIKNQ